MTNKVYQVPYGTKDILPGEMKSRRRIENAIVGVCLINGAMTR